MHNTPRQFSLKFLIAYLAFSLIFISGPNIAVAKLILVPDGNRNQSQPKIPRGAISRTKKTKSSFDKKFNKIFKLLSNNKKLIAKIKKSAATFNIDPIHIIGALVGEHTYNVDGFVKYLSFVIVKVFFYDLLYDKTENP